MTDLRLEMGEGILMQTNDVGIYDGNDELEVYELYLTNKNIIYVHEKSTGMFKSETVVERIPLSAIAVINGIVQVEQVNDDDYGRAMQIVYTSGKRELFEFSSKKQYPAWKTAIVDAVIGLTTNAPTPQPFTVPHSSVKKEESEKAFDNDIDISDENITAGNEETVMEEKKYIFCSNCGEKLVANSKFCNSCGTPTSNIKPPVTEQINERKTVYDGEIHKCPNCGEVLNSFVTNCPSCGCELRGAKNSSAVREFAEKLEAIEAGRVQQKTNPIKNLYFGQPLTKTDEQKISLIRSFAIPNTREDLYEFLILSSSNIDVDSYENDNQLRSDARKAVSDAWKAKFQQAYQKAKLMFADDPKFEEIEKIYNSTNTSIKKAKWKTWKLLGIIYGILIAFVAIVLILALSISANSEKKEIKRLEDIVSQIELALENEDYKLALMNADSLNFNGTDSGLARDWEIKREYWIDKVIEEAAENGVILEKPIDKNNDNSASYSEEVSNESNSTLYDEIDIPNDFTTGYEKAKFEKYNSPASENGLGESRIYFYCTLDKTEILDASGTTSILGYVTDDTGNQWLIQLHFVPAVSKTAFDSYIGQQLVLRGVYTGFSGTKNMPVVVLDEMIVLGTGENVVGMQKLLDE